MTAIRPERLKREAEGLKRFGDDPAKLRWHVVDLLEFYADRTKRHAMTERVADATVRFRIPPPVVDEIKRSLVEIGSQDAENALNIANELWSVEIQEARLLALSVLSKTSSDALINTITIWSKSTRDKLVLESLAELTCQGLLNMGVEALQEHVLKWLQSRNVDLRKLALQTMIALARDEERDQIHTVFEILSNAGFRKAILSRPGYLKLLEVLVDRNPGEAAGYLLEGLKRGQGELNRLVQQLLLRFPTSQRVRLEEELRIRRIG